MDIQINFRYEAEEVRREVERSLQNIGILCRVFGRGKDSISLNDKLARQPGKYSINSRLIQDAIGIRVAVYFSEDVDIAAKILESKYKLNKLSSTIDFPDTDQFSVTRHNLIFSLPNHFSESMISKIQGHPIDAVFEVQLRSILSEGWHEVEHDLRYKSKSNWIGQNDLSRALNGIFATIETAEWGMKKIFDELAYRNYRGQKWPEMLHTLLRMRTSPTLSPDICKLLDSDQHLAKKIFKIDRRKVIFFLNKLMPGIPVNLDNIVYVWNHISLNHEEIFKVTPKFILERIKSNI